MNAPRVVLVTRSTELEALLARHATRAQARFFLERRGQRIEDLEERHERFSAAMRMVSQAIPQKWRRAQVTRSDLSRFVFEPSDLVVPVGQDGLVANAAKYLRGQLVIGINPDRARFDGVLVPHAPERAGALLAAAAAGRCEVQQRTMVEAALDDGQRLLALNEIFVGHRSHQSARYRVRAADREERQSSSGVLIATGTGSTGWAKSIQGERRAQLELPRPEDARLAFFVREAFSSVSTGASLTAGVLGPHDHLEVISEMGDGGVVFGDGIEDDRLELGWGMVARVGIAETRLHLVH
jgi:NAD kinase